MFLRALLLCCVVCFVEASWWEPVREDRIRWDVCSESDDDLCSGSTARASMCRCDADCHRYGDCCVDLLPFPEADDDSPWRCASHGGREFYVVAKCPPDVDDEDALALSCTRKSLRLRALQDVPVFSEATRTMYANVFCAACHQDISALRSWRVDLHCSRNSGNADEVTRLLRAKKFRYSSLARSLIYLRADKRRVICHLHVDMMSQESFFDELYGVRECRLHFSGGCLPGADPQDVRRCGQYTAMVYSPQKMANYRNVHCAKCHGAPVSGLQCGALKAGYNSDTIELKHTVVSLETTFRNTERSPGVTGIYDPFADECFEAPPVIRESSTGNIAVAKRSSSTAVVLLLSRVIATTLADW